MKNGFIRFPTDLVETLLRLPLTGVQWRILLWVVRQTYGWNRERANFSWYRMAKELGVSRPALYRAGQGLLKRGVLVLREGQLAVEVESIANRQLLIPGLDVAERQRFSLTSSNAPVANQQLKRCQLATLFRRAKDRSKDILKTYKDTRVHAQASREPAKDTQRRFSAGAARPVPGKYRHL